MARRFATRAKAIGGVDSADIVLNIVARQPGAGPTISRRKR
jgi:hypothetical protein